MHRRDLQSIPAVFVNHGSPMNAIERNRYTESWRAFGASIPKPKAISDEVEEPQHRRQHVAVA
jgi:aromatic ring-opening dioxygenase catalytic subunit (LigB family)